MRFSDAKGHKVVSKASADTVGKVNDFVIDPKAQKVAAVILKKSSGDGDTLAWADIASFGEDAVIVADETVIVDATGDLVELSDKRHAADGKRVLTTAGVDLGDVDDVDFDIRTGEITALLLDDDEVEGSRLMAVGSYAVIVEDRSPPAAEGATGLPIEGYDDLTAKEAAAAIRQLDDAGDVDTMAAYEVRNKNRTTVTGAVASHESDPNADET